MINRCATGATSTKNSSLAATAGETLIASAAGSGISTRWSSAETTAASSSSSPTPSSRAVANQSVVVHDRSFGKRASASKAMHSLLSSSTSGWKTVSTSASSQTRRMRDHASYCQLLIGTERFTPHEPASRRAREASTCPLAGGTAPVCGCDLVEQLVGGARVRDARGRAGRVQRLDLARDQPVVQRDQQCARQKHAHRLAELELARADQVVADDERVRLVRHDDLEGVPRVEAVADRLEGRVAVEREHQGLGDEPAAVGDQHPQASRVGEAEPRARQRRVVVGATGAVGAGVHAYRSPCRRLATEMGLALSETCALHGESLDRVSR